MFSTFFNIVPSEHSVFCEMWWFDLQGYHSISPFNCFCDILLSEPGCCSYQQLWHRRVLPHPGLQQWVHLLHWWVAHEDIVAGYRITRLPMSTLADETYLKLKNKSRYCVSDVNRMTQQCGWIPESFYWWESIKIVWTVGQMCRSFLWGWRTMICWWLSCIGTRLRMPSQLLVSTSPQKRVRPVHCSSSLYYQQWRIVLKSDLNKSSLFTNDQVTAETGLRLHTGPALGQCGSLYSTRRQSAQDRSSSRPSLSTAAPSPRSCCLRNIWSQVHFWHAHRHMLLFLQHCWNCSCLPVCADNNHVRTWTVTRFRGMISTQPGSTPLSSFKILSLDDVDGHGGCSAGTEIGNSCFWKITYSRELLFIKS